MSHQKLLFIFSDKIFNVSDCLSKWFYRHMGISVTKKKCYKKTYGYHVSETNNYIIEEFTLLTKDNEWSNINVNLD